MKKLRDIELALTSVAYKGSMYLNKITDFPSYSVSRVSSSRDHLSNNVQIIKCNFVIRGYVMSDEDSTDDIEILIRQFEEQLYNIRKDFIDIRVISIDTDSGLLSPYGVCNLMCEAVWYDC